MRKQLAVLSVFLAGVPASASMYGATVSHVMLHNEYGGAIVRLNNQTSMPNPSGCGRADFYILLTTHPHYQQAYAALLTAVSTKRPVDVVVSGCAGGMPNIVVVTVT